MQPADARRQVRQRAVGAHRVQQLRGAERAGGEHDLVGGERVRPGAGVVRVRRSGRSRPRTRRGGGAPVVTVVSAQHLGAGPLGEVQVVLHQRVLRVVPAAGHALAAVDAGVARRADAAEVRVGVAGAPKCTPTSARTEGVAEAHVVGDLAHHAVGG